MHLLIWKSKCQNVYVERLCQCRMEQETPDGLVVVTGYIEEYAAKVGNRVTLKDQEGYWLVKTVSAPTLKEQVLNQQNKNRNPFLSIVK